MIQFLNDYSKMPFGKWKGKEMANVPDDYLQWFWDENKHAYLNDFWLKPETKAVMKYIEDFCEIS